MDKATLIASLDFARMRLLGTLDVIESTARDKNLDIAKVLAWRPGPGRAHIGWQAMHLAATLDRYVNTHLFAKPVNDAALVADFAGGSTPSDQNVPALAAIREKLAATLQVFRSYITDLAPADLNKLVPGPGGKERSLADIIILLTWHETHHQGQIHITWNMYKAANGIG